MRYKIEDFPNNEIDRCKIYKLEMVLGASDRVNIKAK